MNQATIRLLAPSDAAAYTVLRREMLSDSPWAFSASTADDAGLDAEVVAGRLARPEKQAIVGAWGADGSLVGAVGVIRGPQIKMAHRARFWGVYVSPPFREGGVGGRLILAALDVARRWPGVNSVGLSVSANSPGARRLYERYGFQAWGVEPSALVHDGRAYDEVHMCLFL